MYHFNGSGKTQVKYCRIIELQDGKDADELWLYIRKYEDGTLKYAFTNAPADIEIGELHYASTLRWPIEQSFQECKSFLGMGHYETRSYLGWYRHMLMVMVAHLFVVEVRYQFQKKRTSSDNATGPDLNHCGYDAGTRKDQKSTARCGLSSKE